MTTIIIIPIHKQVDNLTKIIYGLEHQTNSSFKVLFIFDRPGAREFEQGVDLINSSVLDAMIHSVNSVPVGIVNRVHGEDVFLTPYIRNLGIDMGREIGCTNFIFIDGDCVPQSNLVNAHNCTSSHDLPVLSIGRRREKTHNWKDQREVDRSLSMLNLFRSEGMVINNLQMLKSSIIVWSCNISLNIAAIKLLERFNMHYYGRSEIFSSEFVGTWGGEDGFLGIEAYYSGIYINMIGDTQGGVKHIDHPRPINKYGHVEHTKYLSFKITELGELMIKRPLSLKFFNPMQQV